jgi:cephalosporin hydroxylase
MRDEALLPDPVSVSLDQDMRSYWVDRAQQHTTDYYAGVRISKFPEDLRTYEHLLWLSRANVVVELGTQFGGSTLWLRDRLVANARYGHIAGPRVIGADIQIEPAREAIATADPGYADTITLLEGDVCDPAFAAEVTALVPEGARCLVIEDSAHVYDTTLASLTGFAHLVPLGGYFVVEDGCVDVEDMRIADTWPRGVLPALDAWLETPQGAQFTVRRDLERYGLTCHPRGFLERIAES